MNLHESIQDPTALKLVFLAGSPGSGKSHVANQVFGFGDNVSFGAKGMKLVSFDNIFVKLLKKAGLGTDLSKLSPDLQRKVMDRSNPHSLRSIAANMRKRQFKHLINAGTGIVWEGTGQSVEAFMDRMEEARRAGYDPSLIYVDTDLPTALKRNSMRQRKLPDDVIKHEWDLANGNKARLKKLFGDNMISVDNRNEGDLPKAIQRAIHHIVSKPVQNPIGRQRLAKEAPKPVSHNAKVPHHQIRTPNAPINKEPPAQSTKLGDILDRHILNPLTRRNIKIRSALSYPEDHPAHIEAKKVIRRD